MYKRQSFDPASSGADLAGVLVQYPDTLGRICDYTDFFSRVHATGALLSLIHISIRMQKNVLKQSPNPLLQ